MTVLLVDDEKTVRDGLKVVINWREYGFDTILEGEDGNDGLVKMVGANPELTLLDIRMPKMSGLEAAEQARKAGYEGSIIMLSGYSDFKYAQSAIRFGVDAYLLKSIDEDELTAAVEKVRENVRRKAETALAERNHTALSNEDARRLAKGKFYQNAGGIACIDGNAFSMGNGTALDLQNTLEKIQAYVEASEPEKINAFLLDLKQRIITQRIEPDKVKGILSNLYIGLQGKLRKSYPGNPCDFPSESDVVDTIFDMDYLDEITNYLAVEFCRISAVIAVSNKDITHKIINYIEKNSSRDLKLESLAELFGYNSNYLGKIFKKIKGESFNTYLDRIRIEKAKALLKDQSFKVYEICEMVGYRNLNYFYIKFKRFVGVSPSDYRHNMQTK